MKAGGSRKRDRVYLPKVEALEALRLLHSALPTVAPPPVDRAGVVASAVPLDSLADHDAWDAALGQTGVAELLAPTPSAAVADPAAINAGLVQLNSYLSRAWARAGIDRQYHDDCTQAVYAALLQKIGRAHFDQLAADVGRSGIRDVFSRDTTDGPDFFRAIDMVKKRALRERSFQPLDDRAASASGAGTGDAEAWRGALHEAISRSLNAREARVIEESLLGFSPAEIARKWGVAPKTVSNEKSRALSKLRVALVSDLTD